MFLFTVLIKVEKKEKRRGEQWPLFFRQLLTLYLLSTDKEYGRHSVYIHIRVSRLQKCVQHKRKVFLYFASVKRPIMIMKAGTYFKLFYFFIFWVFTSVKTTGRCEFISTTEWFYIDLLYFPLPVMLRWNQPTLMSTRTGRIHTTDTKKLVHMDQQSPTPRPPPPVHSNIFYIDH